MTAVSAMNTGFEISDLPENEINDFISNVNLWVINDEPDKQSISCFDVNKSGLVAIGQGAFERKTVCVYSSTGDFQYGYTFNSSGSFGLEWDAENLNIYFYRSSVIISVTPTGEIVDVFEVEDSKENNSYVNKFIHATERTVGSTEYCIRNNMGIILNFIAPSYSQIVIKDADGAENIIYDVNSMQLAKMITVIVIVCIFVGTAIGIIVRRFSKYRKKTDR